MFSEMTSRTERYAARKEGKAFSLVILSLLILGTPFAHAGVGVSPAFALDTASLYHSPASGSSTAFTINTVGLKLSVREAISDAFSVDTTNALSVSATPATVIAGFSGGQFTVQVGNAGGFPVSFTASSSNPWVVLAAGDRSGVLPIQGSRTLRLSVSSNVSSSPRSGVIHLALSGTAQSGLDVLVSQQGTAPPVSVAALQISPIPASVQVNTPVNLTVSARTSTDGLAAVNGQVNLYSQISTCGINLSHVSLVNGQWQGSVKFLQPVTRTRLVGQGTFGGVSLQAASNTFNVTRNAAGDTGKLTVTVKNSAGMFVSGATVQVLHDDTGELLEQGATGSSGGELGVARFTPPPGRYRVSAAAPDGSLSKRALVDVAAGKETPCSLVLAQKTRAVLFVPGIMGSTMKGTAGMPYLAGRPGEPKNLELANLMAIAVGQTTAPWIGDYVGWKRLENLLSDHYIVVPAPYDWRLPVDKAAAQYLVAAIDEAKRLSGCDKVDIVAHSMGGLVTRAYIEGGGYRNDIDKFAMVGTPNTGSSKAYYIWEGGDPFVPPDKGSFYWSVLSKTYNAMYPGQETIYRHVNQGSTPALYSDSVCYQPGVRAFVHADAPGVANLLPVYSFLVPVYPILMSEGGQSETILAAGAATGGPPNTLISSMNGNLTRINARYAWNRTSYPDKVKARLFASQVLSNPEPAGPAPDKVTIRNIHVRVSSLAQGLYEYGEPVDDGSPTHTPGDGTVPLAVCGKSQPSRQYGYSY